jgi:hypothetical protein
MTQGVSLGKGTGRPKPRNGAKEHSARGILAPRFRGYIERPVYPRLMRRGLLSFALPRFKKRGGSETLSAL